MGLFGRAQYHAEADNGWEHFSNASHSDDFCAADWANIVRRAQAMGATVEFTKKGIVISHGKSEGTFKDYKGGVAMAESFLEEIA
jgi:hypothetical protein